MPAPVLVLNRWTREANIIVPDVILVYILSYARVWSIIIQNSSKYINAGFCPGDNNKSTISIPPLTTHTNDSQLLINKWDEKRCIKQNMIIRNEWCNIKSIYNYIFKEELFYPAQNTKLLMTEPPCNPRRNRERITEIMFESFEIEKFGLICDAVLALYGATKSNGIVINVGYDCFEIVGVYEGYHCSKTYVRIPIGEKHCKLYLQNEIETSTKQKKIKLSTSDIYEIINGVCFIDNINAQPTAADLTPYLLPDGNNINVKLTNTQKYELFEQYFEPHMFGRDSNENIANLLMKKTFFRIDDCIDRDRMAQNTIIVGNAWSKNGYGFNNRLYNEFINRLKSYSLYKIKINGVNDPGNAIWRGAHMFCESENMDQYFICEDDYHECGANIIHRKCDR